MRRNRFVPEASKTTSGFGSRLAKSSRPLIVIPAINLRAPRGGRGPNRCGRLTNEAFENPRIDNNAPLVEGGIPLFGFDAISGNFAPMGMRAPPARFPGQTGLP